MQFLWYGKNTCYKYSPNNINIFLDIFLLSRGVESQTLLDGGVRMGCFVFIAFFLPFHSVNLYVRCRYAENESFFIVSEIAARSLQVYYFSRLWAVGRNDSCFGIMTLKTLESLISRVSIELNFTGMMTCTTCKKVPVVLSDRSRLNSNGISTWSSVLQRYLMRKVVKLWENRCPIKFPLRKRSQVWSRSKDSRRNKRR